MEVFNSYVAFSNVYLPDAITTLKYGAEAQTLEDARDRIQEAATILACLLKLSQEAALELKASNRPVSQTQEAEAVLKCLLQFPGPSSKVEGIQSTG
jgi:hypothetical protein